MNAWTMIWASCLSVFLLHRALGWLSTAAAADELRDGSGGGGGMQSYRGPALPDSLPFLLLTAATLLHAPFSIGFHMFRGICAHTYNLWRRLDQVFIFQVGVGGRCSVYLAAGERREGVGVPETEPEPAFLPLMEYHHAPPRPGLLPPSPTPPPTPNPLNPHSTTTNTPTTTRCPSC